MRVPKIKKYQKKFEYSYSFGAYPTISLLENRRDSVAKVLIKEEGRDSDGVRDVISKCEEFGIPLEENSRLIDKIAVKENTYVVGIFYKYDSTISLDSNHLILDNPTNMGNMGTIMRTLLGFGFKDLGVIKPSVDIFDPMVIRSSMGAIFNINFEFFENIQEYISKYGNHNLYPFMLKGAKDIREVEFKKPYTIVQGNESRGLSDEYMNLGQSVYIPQSEDIDSLNLSIATGIGLWEVYRRSV